MSVHYACDAWSPDWPAQLDQKFTQTAGHAYMLVDCGFHPAQGDYWRHHPEESFIALHAGTPLAESEEVGLFLGPMESAEDCEPLVRALAADSGIPMVAWLWSDSPIDVLATHLRRYIEVRTPDGLAWPLRLGDTRCLLDIAAVLRAEAPAFHTGFRCWRYVDRAGRFADLIGTQSQDASTTADAGVDAAPTPAPISDDAFARLVKDGETDEALLQMLEMDAQLLKAGRASELHARLQVLIKQWPMREEPLADRLRYWLAALRKPPHSL